MDDTGGTSNTSFCSNSACHGTAFTFAGFDAPKLREVLQSQIPTPAPTPAPVPIVGIPTYNANISLIFNNECKACHNSTTLAGGMDLTSYAGTMKGGKDGPVILPGESSNSLLIKIQSDKHFMNLSQEELKLVEQWIDGGAPEK
jgi:hypothetical protein